MSASDAMPDHSDETIGVEDDLMSEANVAVGAGKLPFTFAKQFGVLLDDATVPPVVVHMGFPGAAVLAELHQLRQQGVAPRQAVTQVAQQFALPRRQVYRLWLQL